MMVRWIGKKVFLELGNGRVYSGKVIDETEVKIILIDKYNKQVELSKIDIRLIQEEE